MDGHIKGVALAAEIFSQLLCSCFQSGVCFVCLPSACVWHVLLTLHKPNPRQTLLRGSKQHLAEW
jgi:hypothetical protein